MLTLRSLQFGPPGGKWFYTVPETNAYFESRMSFRELEYKVKQHYRVNRMEIPVDLCAQIQDHMCRQLPEGGCFGWDQELGRRPRHVTLFDISGATEEIFRKVQRERVPLCGEAEWRRRAEICKTCRLNSLGLCSSCTGLQQMARAFLRKPAQALDPYLGVCLASLGVLVGMLWLPGEWLYKNGVKYEEGVPTSCWMKLRP